MKTYIVKLKSGETCEFDVESYDDLLGKIVSEQYGILPIYSLDRVTITRLNVDQIAEKNNDQKGIGTRTEETAQ